MRRVALCLTLLLGACASLGGVNPDIDYQVLVRAVVDQCDAVPDPNAPPFTAMEVGFAKVQAACESFFVDATRAQQNALYADRSLDAGLVGATAILNATTSAASAAKAITITTAGVVLSKALIDQYTATYAFGTHLYKVRQLVTARMETFAADARKSPPANYCLAYTYVQKFATLCSLAAMQASLDEQVAIPSVPTVPATPPRIVTGQGVPPSLPQHVVVPRGGPAPPGPPSISTEIQPIR